MSARDLDTRCRRMAASMVEQRIHPDRGSRRLFIEHVAGEIVREEGGALMAHYQRQWAEFFGPFGGRADRVEIERLARRAARAAAEEIAEVKLNTLIRGLTDDEGEAPHG